MGSKNDKTNVMRLLDNAKISYKVHLFDAEAVPSGSKTADILGIDHDMMFKTLVTVGTAPAGKPAPHYVFVIPADSVLDLKKAAKAADDKSVEMVKSRELLPLTGYIHGGCSPIGMKKPFKTFVDETAQLFDTIVFSGGRVGHLVEVAPEDLAKMVDFIYCDLTVD